MTRPRSAYRQSIAQSPGAAGPLLAEDPYADGSYDDDEAREERRDYARRVADWNKTAVLVTLADDTLGDEALTELGWQDRALCAQTDPEAFFPEKGGSTREAKRTCRSCEVRAECLEYALENDERFGIWGGLSERERRRLNRKPV